MSDTLFAGDQLAPPAEGDNQTPPATPAFTVPAEVADLIGEGKKYANVEAALASIPNAQAHISTIEGENAEYKNAMMSNDKLDQVLAKLAQPTPTPVATPPAEGLSQDDVSIFVQQEIARTEKVNLEKANLTAVESKLRELNGENVGEVFNTKAAEVGMSPAQLTTLAKVSPQAVLALFGNTKPGAASPTPSSAGVDLSTVGDIGDNVSKKNIMFGASTKEVIAEWKMSAPTIEE